MTAEIRTPDHRIRVFISSTLAELADERVAARDAVESLRLIPVLFELGARPHPPRTLYRSYLDQSDVFIGIYWERYGWIAPDEDVSGLEDEYRLAAGRLPQLVYVKEPATAREERLDALLQRIQDDDRLAYRRFRDADELRSLIADDLAVLLSERFDARTGAPDAGDAASAPQAPLERTLGRAHDVDAIRDVVRSGNRLVTLTGPGGIGKTRLAIEVSRALVPSDVARSVFVGLAPVDDAALVVPLIAERLGVRLGGIGDVRDEIAAELRHRPALLVLDNFEHVAAAAPDVAAVLERAPESTAIITSRHVLRVRGEREYSVPPLADDDAVALFVARASAARPGFTLDDTNRDAVAEICARLDGLPLAIELAAACMRLFTPAALLAHLAERFTLLTRGSTDVPRQQTLRATMDWSHELLEPAEQRLFARLAVFHGGWTLDGATAVCSRPDEPDVMDLTASLVEKSLVASVDAGIQPRLHMLETVRAYAAEKLATIDDRVDVEHRHTMWMFELLLGESRSIRPPHHESWLEQFDLERANLRAAVQRALDARDVATVTDLIRATLGYLSLRDAEPEAAAWFDDAMALDVAVDDVLRARMLMTRAVLAGALGRYDEASSFIDASLAAGRPDDPFDTAIAAMAEAVVASAQREPGEALELARAAARAMAAIGSDVGEAYMWQTAGTVAISCDPECADDHLELALGLAEQMANDGLRAQALTLLGFSARRAGRADEARRLFVDAAVAAEGSGQRSGMAYALDGLAAAAIDAGKPFVAARALASSAAIRSSLDRTPWAAFHPLLEEIAASVHALLGEDAHAAAITEGSNMDVRQALARTSAEV